ncbi:hypothetical protein GIB67_002969 [Kingdonia uniflora]|uniref:Uncharacterized protein n=1 Tax=Kingdonia uniflora TaxID=39325 RepID=A0A7J7M903_9MAGN|nr:hypothetical protein GIB67_002969 [Kingdonia uniflora]
MESFSYVQYQLTCRQPALQTFTTVLASTVQSNFSSEDNNCQNSKRSGGFGRRSVCRHRMGWNIGQGRGIHADVHKEIAKKGFKHHTKVWAIVNSLKNQDIKVILDDNDSSTSDR